MNEAPRLPESNKPALQWQLSFALLVGVVVVFLFWKALLYLAVFSGAGITAAVLGMSAKQSKPLSIGGGFIAGIVAVYALSAIFGSSTKPVPDNVQASAASKASQPKRFHQSKAGTPVYFFKPLYTDKRHCAFEYESLPSGAVRFIDAYDHREYCMTQPFGMREQPLPESAVKDAPADLSALEQARNDILKIYLITSYATVKGYRYTTFRYAIDRNGTVHFDQRGSKLAIPPPYIIQEDFMGEGNHPKIPNYPPSPDRG